MYKPSSLREYLTVGMPHLKTAGERLQVRVESGRVVAAFGRGLSFEYRYSLKLTFLDFLDRDQDRLFALIVAWLSRHQRELLLNAELAENAISFEADDLGGGKLDVEITLPLIERVRAQPREGGGYDLDHPIEEAIPEDLAPPSLLHELYANGELLMACEAHHPAEP